jgi:hypothetical protein
VAAKRLEELFYPGIQSSYLDKKIRNFESDSAIG